MLASQSARNAAPMIPPQLNPAAILGLGNPAAAAAAMGMGMGLCTSGLVPPEGAPDFGLASSANMAFPGLGAFPVLPGQLGNPLAALGMGGGPGAFPLPVGPAGMPLLPGGIPFTGLLPPVAHSQMPGMDMASSPAPSFAQPGAAASAERMAAFVQTSALGGRKTPTQQGTTAAPTLSRRQSQSLSSAKKRAQRNTSGGLSDPLSSDRLAPRIQPRERAASESALTSSWATTMPAHLLPHPGPLPNPGSLPFMAPHPPALINPMAAMAHSAPAALSGAGPTVAAGNNPAMNPALLMMAMMPSMQLPHMAPKDGAQ